MRKRMIFIAPLAILGMVVFVFIGGEIVKLLWNWLLPQIFNVRQITFWQAFGMLALCRILVGGFGLHRGSRYGWRGRMADRMAEHVADRVGDRWERMTPEQRERFRQRVRERCGFDPSSGESKEEVK